MELYQRSELVELYQRSGCTAVFGIPSWYRPVVTIHNASTRDHDNHLWLLSPSSIFWNRCLSNLYQSTQQKYLSIFMSIDILILIAFSLSRIYIGVITLRNLALYLFIDIIIIRLLFFQELEHYLNTSEMSCEVFHLKHTLCKWNWVFRTSLIKTHPFQCFPAETLREYDNNSPTN